MVYNGTEKYEFGGRRIGYRIGYSSFVFFSRPLTLSIPSVSKNGLSTCNLLLLVMSAT